MIDINITQIIVALVTACIPSYFSYKIAYNKSKTEIDKAKADYEARINEIKQQNLADIEKLKAEYELKLQETENSSVNGIVAEFLRGNLNIEKATQDFNKVTNLAKQAETAQKSKFLNKSKRK